MAFTGIRYELLETAQVTLFNPVSIPDDVGDMARPRMLIILPPATRSGAPMLMLHLVRWFRRHSDFDMSCVVLADAEMTREFADLMPTELFWRQVKTPSAPVRVWRRQKFVASRRTAALVAKCRSVVGQWPPDVVYCNSAGAAGVLDALGPYSCPVVVNVHELEYVLNAIDWVPGGAVPAMVRHATHFVAGSHAVRRNLIDRHAIPGDRVSVIHDCIPTADFPISTTPSRPAAIAGLPADAAVVGFIATVEWRKGADLLVPLAIEVLRRTSSRPIHLVWVGGGKPSDVAEVGQDVAAAGLVDRVHFVGPTDRTADWYPAFRAFGLLSREDPFPLVALEAAVSGLPVICFAGGGGMPEFVEDDAGMIVPYSDLAAYADAVVRVVNDQALCDRLGNRAAEKVRQRHDSAVAARQVSDLIHRLLQQSPVTPGPGGGRGKG